MGRDRASRSGWRRVAVRWVLLGAWLAVVLALGSSKIFPENHDPLRWLIRKGAHVGEYAVLSFLLYRALSLGDSRRRLLRGVPAFLLVILFAGVEEWRQSFVPGRSGRIADVGFDAAGSGLGLTVAWLSGWMRDPVSWRPRL